MATPFPLYTKQWHYQQPLKSQMVLRVCEHSHSPQHITEAFKLVTGKDFRGAMVEMCVPFLFSRVCTLVHDVKWSQITFRRNMTPGTERDEYAATRIDPSFRKRCAMLNDMAYKALECGDVAEAAVVIKGVTRINTREYLELTWACKETIVRKSMLPEKEANEVKNKELKALLNSHIPRSHRKKTENIDVATQDECNECQMFIAIDKSMRANMSYARSMQLLFEDGIFEQRCVETQHVQECAGAMVAWPPTTVDMEF